MDLDPKWEFNANKYVDFNRLEEEENTNADEFFDYDMESGERIETSDSDFQVKDTQISSSGIGNINGPLSDEIPKSRKPSNLVTSWGSGVVKIKANTKIGSKPESSSEIRPAIIVVPPKSVKSVRAVTPRTAQVEPSIASVRSSPRNKTPKRLGTNSNEPRLARSRTGSSQSVVSKYQTKPSAAIPKTPEVMKRYKAKLDQAQQYMRTRGNKLMKRSEPSLKIASKPTLTKTAEFKFAMENRAKSVAVKAGTSDGPDFTKLLRSYEKSGSDSGSTSGITQPVSYNLATARRRSYSADPHKVKYQTELIPSYQKGTSERFRSRPPPSAGSSSSSRTRHRSASPATSKLAIPLTPHLSTRTRSRPTHVLSREEREQLELEEAKANQFKAKKVGETVPKFKYGDVERKPCTRPQPFHLTNDGQPNVAALHIEEPTEQFHARPMPKAMVSAPQGVPIKKLLPVVEPQSPAFALKGRMAERKLRVEPEAPEPVLRARPAPHRGVPVTLPPPCKKKTVAEPFSFAERDKAWMEKREDKIKQVLKEEKKGREFHAQPIIKEDHFKAPAIQSLAPTKPEPFKLKLEERVEARLTQWQENVEKELEDQKKATLFKASEPKVLNQVPFTTKPSDKPLSEISNFTLHSDRRAEEREAFDLKVKQKEVELEGAKREQEERKKREELEEITRIRKASVHKPQPIRSYKPIDVRPSDKPLTNPSSPHFQAGRNKFNGD